MARMDCSHLLLVWLTIGSVDAIHRSVPAASAVFQVMKGMSPKVNMDPFVLPLVDMFDRVGELMEPWNPSHEVMSGLIRVDLPDFDRGAFREAMINAFCHRDYARMGSVRFLVDEDGLTIANPGGFIEGVSEDNLLTAQPRSRNPQLALILKAAGYVERTGEVWIPSMPVDCGGWFFPKVIHSPVLRKLPCSCAAWYLTRHS